MPLNIFNRIATPEVDGDNQTLHFSNENCDGQKFQNPLEACLAAVDYRRDQINDNREYDECEINIKVPSDEMIQRGP